MKVTIPGIRTKSETFKTSNDQAVGQRYTDLEITSIDKFVSGDITISRAQEAITGSVRNILLTSFGELVYDYNAGANLTSLLFDSDVDEDDVADVVFNAIQEEDDRVDVIEVVVERSDEHTVDVTVTVNVKGDDTLQNIELTHRIKKLKN